MLRAFVFSLFSFLSFSSLTFADVSTRREVALTNLSNRVVSAGRGGYAVRFHVEARVENLAFEKDVGVRTLISDGTSTSQHDCKLGFVEALDESRELWAADCHFPVYMTSGDFDVYATMNKVTYRDDNFGKRYDLMRIASPDRGVEHRGVELAQNNESGRICATIMGMVFPFESRSKEVGVVYSTDHWKTYTRVQTALKPGSTEFTTRLDLPPASTGEYILFYRVDGVEYIDNNDGQNFSL